MLANDMHLELTAPGIWFENHLVGGRLNIAGVVMPGVPLIIAGHNRRVAWAYTDSFADTQDLYEEHIRQGKDGRSEMNSRENGFPSNPALRESKSRAEKLLRRKLTPIMVQSSTAFLKMHFPIWPMALRWTALEPAHTFEAVYEMNLSEDCFSFREALRKFDDPSQNIVYADTKGNIAYTLNGRIPIRVKGDGFIPSPGWTGDQEWTGYIPFEELPQLFNPSSGFIATANNQVQRSDFPHFIGKDYVISDRAGRIVELLKTDEKVDIPYYKKMQFDLISPSGRSFCRSC